MKRITEPFGKAGLIVAVVALVAAMVGGAYAANNHGGSHRKKAHHKKKGPKFVTRPQAIAIAKKFAGEGPAGPQGPKGDKGDAGANGSDGANGTNGTDGSPGANGKSVVVGSFSGEDEEFGEPAGEPCELQGGTEVEVENTGDVHYVCNGKDGSPWTVGGTLPPGETETGSWAYTATAAGTFTSSISFTIPLEAGLDASHVHYNEPGTADCPGTVGAPSAAKGNLCVYPKSGGSTVGIIPPSGFPSGPPFNGPEGTDTDGAILIVNASAAGNGYGSWAVTEAE